MVEKVEILSPPAIDLDSVKASLADYKVGKVNAHLATIRIWFKRFSEVIKCVT